MPPEPRFEHHGIQAETREAWAARQAAEAAARAARERRAAEDAKLARAGAAAPPVVVASPAAGKRRVGVRVPVLTAVTVAAVVLLLAAATRTVPSAEPAASPPVASPPPAGEVVVGTPVELGSLVHSPFGATWSDTPTIDPSPAGWWCICYRTNAGDERTACRRTGSECEALRTMIQTRGSAAIQRGSASGDRCRHVARSYPWESLGHGYAWKVSAFSDAPDAGEAAKERRRATQAVGVCAL